MLKNNAIVVLFLALIVICFSSCELSDDSSVYKFEILSSGNGFTGYYYLNNDARVEFSVTTKEVGAIYYSYVQDLTAAQKIYISTDGLSAPEETSSITIHIFENDGIVKTIQGLKTTNGSEVIPATVSILYEFTDTSED